MLAGDSQVIATAYESRFDGWYDRATIRSRPRRMLAPGEHYYFSPELVPWATHQLVAGKGEQAVRRVLVRRLYSYLHFTTELEQLAVIPIATAIARGRSGLTLPDSMRADAYKIVTDEAWHAQFSFDLLEQVEQATGLPRQPLTLPAFVGRLDRIRDQLDPQLRGVEDLMFSIVSETLISSILADLPRDRRLPAAVRNLVLDHAQDEGRHHSYFRSLLQYLWPQLSAEQQRQIGPSIPDMIEAFLTPDPSSVRQELLDAGLSAQELEQVAEESMALVIDGAEIRNAARTAVRYFSEVGVLRDGQSRQAFMAAGMLSDDGTVSDD